VGTALQRLETGGLVTSAADGFGLDTSVFTRVARTAAPPQKTEDYGYADEQTESVVRTFVREGGCRASRRSAPACWPCGGHCHRPPGGCSWGSSTMTSTRPARGE